MTDLSELSDDELMAAAVMPSLIHQESSGRVGVLGPKTKYGVAQGQTQMLPKTAEATAKRLGVAWRPELMTGTSPEAADYQAGLGQAYLEEGLAQTGNLPDALRYYHGGPDRKLWGPKTEAYQASIMAKSGLGGSQAPASDLSGMSDADLMAIAGQAAPKPAKPPATPRTTAPQASLAAMKKFAGPAPSVVKDVAKAVPSGLMGTLASMNPQNVFGGGGVMDVLGQAADKAAMIQDLLKGKAPSLKAGPGLSLPGARASQLQVNTSGQNYTPKTRPGLIAKTAGAMLPNVVAPGSIPQKLAAVALPTLGTEGAGALAEKLGAGPKGQAAARFAGGLLGGVASSARVTPGVTRAKAMSLDELKAASSGAWDKVDASGFRFAPKDVKDASKDVAKLVADEGGAALYPDAAKVAKRVAQLAASGDLSVAKLNRLKSQVGEKLMGLGSTEAHVGGAIRDRLETLMTSSADPAIAKARDLYTRVKKVEEVTKRMESADLQAGTTYTGGNLTNATRQKLRPLIDPKSPQRIRNLTPEETKALRDVARGTGGQNAIRYASKVLTNKFIQAGLAWPTHGVGPISMEALGVGLRKLGEKSASKQLERLIELMASGGHKGVAAKAKVSVDPALAAARATTMSPGLIGSAYANQGASR